MIKIYYVISVLLFNYILSISVNSELSHSKILNDGSFYIFDGQNYIELKINNNSEGNCTYFNETDIIEGNFTFLTILNNNSNTNEIVIYIDFCKENKTLNCSKNFSFQLDSNFSNTTVIIINKNDSIYINKSCYEDPSKCNIETDNRYYLEINEKKISHTIMTHFFLNGGIYGFFIIPIGIFISFYGSIHYIITSSLYGIFFLFAFLNFLTEENPVFIESISKVVYIVVVCVIIGGGLGLVLSNKNTKTKKFLKQKIFFGIFFGAIFWKSLLYFCFIPIFAFEDHYQITIRIMRFLIIIPMLLFGFLFYKSKRIKKSFLLNTSISGSYIVINGLNYIIGGFYDETINFHYFDLYEKIPLKMYLIIYIILIVFSSIYQYIRRIMKNKEKNKNKNKREIKDNIRNNEYILDKSISNFDFSDEIERKTVNSSEIESNESDSFLDSEN